MGKLTPEQVDAVLAKAAAEERERINELCGAASLPTRPADPYERRTARQREDHERAVAEFRARLERRERERGATG